MSLKLITAPTEGAVTLDELKAHLRVTDTADDSDLSLKLYAASAFVANEMRRCIVTSTYELRTEEWPRRWSSLWRERSYINVPLGNLQSVTSIKYTNSASVEATMSAAYYKVTRAYTPAGDGDMDAGIGRICLAYGQYWPDVLLDTGEPIVIRFVCGWDTAANVPMPIKQAILMVAGHWFRNRDAVVSERGVVSDEIKLGMERLLSAYSDIRW